MAVPVGAVVTVGTAEVVTEAAGTIEAVGSVVVTAEEVHEIHNVAVAVMITDMAAEVAGPGLVVTHDPDHRGRTTVATEDTLAVRAGHAAGHDQHHHHRGQELRPAGQRREIADS